MKKISEIFKKCFRYQNPSSLAEDLFNTNQTKNNQIVNQATDSINELRNAVIRKEIPENENPNKIKITEKILNFNNQQEGKELKIITPKQMLQRLPINLAQVKVIIQKIYQMKSNKLFIHCIQELF